MRPGVFISAIGHVVLVGFALLGTPKLFDSLAPVAIEVDLVRPDEAPPEPPPEPKNDDKSAPFDPLPEGPPPSPPQQAATTKPQPEPPTQPPNQQAVDQPPGPQPPSPKPTPQDPPKPSIFDPVNIPALLDLPNTPQLGFDSESIVTANLTAEEKAALKAHLRTCWKLPEGISPAQSTRVVIRVYLKRDGVLAGDPTLIEGSASRDGPRLMQAALRTLKDCQPYAFLPAARYKEWRVLDLSFSPRDMAGG
jgi:hypothetical protein